MSTATYDRVKRGVDVALAAMALVVLAPLLLLVALVVALRLGRPVLFRHPRPGVDGRAFTLLKFRSMLEVDVERGLVTDAQRLTPFGAALRATSLDELPSLWNVVRGDMSLVGPRPLEMRYLPRYDAAQARRHDVRPGITGLAQVRGRNAIGWDRRLALDVEYVERRSAVLDVRILGETVRQVLRRDGIAMEGHVSSPEFWGSERIE